MKAKPYFILYFFHAGIYFFHTGKYFILNWNSVFYTEIIFFFYTGICLFMSFLWYFFSDSEMVVAGGLMHQRLVEKYNIHTGEHTESLTKRHNFRENQCLFLLVNSVLHNDPVWPCHQYSPQLHCANQRATTLCNN